MTPSVTFSSEDSGGMGAAFGTLMSTFGGSAGTESFTDALISRI